MIKIRKATAADTEILALLGRLTWNESKYGGINKIFPHQDDIWMPDMGVENT